MCGNVVPAECRGAPQQMISSHDHPRLANYYADQAQELREKAKQWEFTAEFYEKQPSQTPRRTRPNMPPIAGPWRRITARPRMRLTPWLWNSGRCAHTAWSSRHANSGPTRGDPWTRSSSEGRGGLLDRGWVVGSVPRKSALLEREWPGHDEA